MFIELMSTVPLTSSEGVSVVEACERMFDAFDSNQDGCIDIKEVTFSSFVYLIFFLATL